MTRAVAFLILLFTSCTCYGSPAEDAFNRSVLVEIGNESERLGFCSGVVLRTNLVLTAAHCALGDVFRVGDEKAKVLKIDKDSDLLLLEVKTARFRMVTFGKATMGQDVMSVPDMGPFYNRLLFFGKVASLPKDQIWSDMKASPGISGAGLFDTSGRLVGMNNRYLIHKSDIVVVMAAVAVPADIIREFIKGVETK